MVDARFLVLEDDGPTARALTRLVRAHGVPALASSVREATEFLARWAHWTGFLLDVTLPDGSGIDFLAHARRTHPSTPALVLSGCIEHAAINTACDLGAAYLLKPAAPKSIERFLAVASGSQFTAQAGRAVQAWSARCKLSDAEADIFRLAVMGSDRRAIATARRSSEQTINKQVASILRRTGDATLHAAVERLLREVASSNGGHTQS